MTGCSGPGALLGIWIGYLCRPKCSFKLPSVRMRLGFSSPMLSVVDADYRNR